eukprot:jgi/Galph1/3612/GphlegSOOS_G2248.1
MRGNSSPNRNSEEVNSNVFSSPRGRASLAKLPPSPKPLSRSTLASSSFKTLSRLSSSRSTDALRLANALDKIDEIKKKFDGYRPVFFLDFDGTLADIVANPDDARLSPEMRETLRELTDKYAVAIISGRSRHKLKELVNLRGTNGLLYAGSHGFDIGVPSEHGTGDISYHPKLAESFLPSLREVKWKITNEILPNFKGVSLEDNTFSLSIHYRNLVASGNDSSGIQRQVDLLESEIDRMIEPFQEKLEKTYGRKVFEIRLLLNWNKGKAIRWLLHIFSKGVTESWNDQQNLADKIKEVQYLTAGDGLSLSSSPIETFEGFMLEEKMQRDALEARRRWQSEMTDLPFFPLYFGDDVTDEDAFQVLQAENGIGIVVTEVSRPTAAKYRLSTPEEVRLFLSKFLKE